MPRVTGTCACCSCDNVPVMKYGDGEAICEFCSNTLAPDFTGRDAKHPDPLSLMKAIAQGLGQLNQKLNRIESRVASIQKARRL